MRTVLLGASKGCGYFAALQLLETSPQDSITMLLRKPEVIENDPKFEGYIKEGRCKIVKGDATDEEDVRKCFEDKVDFVVSTIGGAGGMTFSGAQLDVPDICTRAGATLVKVLATLPGTEKPRVLVTSSMGIGGSHHIMPLTHRIFYPWLIDKPHQDKEGLEAITKRASTVMTDVALSKHVPAHIFTNEKLEALPQNFLPEVIILRPAWMTDGKVTPGEEIKAGEELTISTIKRENVGRFIVEQCVPGKDQWVNKCPIIGN